MRFQRFDDRYIVRLESGEPVINTLLEFLRSEQVEFANLSAAGAVSGVCLGYWNAETHAYEYREFDEQLEVVSFQGNSRSRMAPHSAPAWGLRRHDPPRSPATSRRRAFTQPWRSGCAQKTCRCVDPMTQPRVSICWTCPIGREPTPTRRGSVGCERSARTLSELQKELQMNTQQKPEVVVVTGGGAGWAAQSCNHSPGAAPTSASSRVARSASKMRSARSISWAAKHSSCRVTLPIQQQPSTLPSVWRTSSVRSTSGSTMP